MRGQIKKNAVAYYAYFLLSSVTVFIASPLLVSSLGPAAFGTFKSVQKALDIVSVADGRAGQALKWVVARLIPHGDSGRLRKAISGATQTAMIFTPLLLTAVLALIFFAPKIFHSGSSVSVESIRILVAVLGANLILAPLMSVPDAVLVGSNRGYVSTTTQAFWFVITNVAMVMAARGGYGVVALGVIVSSGAILNAGCVFVTARASTSWFRWQRPERGEFRTFFGLSGWLLAWAAVEKFLLSAELVLIAALIGTSEASKYVFASYVVQLFLALLLLSVSSATPSIAQLITKSRTRALVAIGLAREGVFCLAVCGACFLLAFNKSFVILWVGNSNYIGDAANCVIALLMAQAALIRCDAQLGDLTLDVRRRSLIGIAGTVLTLAAPGLLYAIGRATPVSVLIAVLASRLVLTVTAASLLRRSLPIPKLRTGQLLLAALLAVCAALIGFRITLANWAQFVTGSLLFVSALVPCVYWFLLSPDGRRTVAASASRLVIRIL